MKTGLEEKITMYLYLTDLEQYTLREETGTHLRVFKLKHQGKIFKNGRIRAQFKNIYAKLYSVHNLALAFSFSFNLLHNKVGVIQSRLDWYFSNIQAE